MEEPDNKEPKNENKNWKREVSYCATISVAVLSPGHCLEHVEPCCMYRYLWEGKRAAVVGILILSVTLFPPVPSSLLAFTLFNFPPICSDLYGHVAGGVSYGLTRCSSF